MDEPVTVTVAYQVSPGREEQFSDWATSMLREAAHYVEYLGGGILGPGGSEDDWHVVFRWSNQEAAQLWEASPARTRLAAKASTFAQVAQAKRTTGVRAWFDLTSKIAVKPPPKWKAALVTLAAVFPPVLLFNLTVIPYLGGLSVVLRTLTLCVAVTGVVTWVMMPRLQRLLKNWLNPPPAAEGVDVGGPPPEETAGRLAGIGGVGRRQRRGWSGGNGGGADDFGYGSGGTATYAGGGAGRDAGAEPAWLVEVAPRGREEDPGWRDDGWRDVKPGRGPWYSSQRAAEPEAEPAPGYRQQASPSYRDRAESAPAASYRDRDRDESAPAASYRDRGEPAPAASYRDRAETTQLPRYRDGVETTSAGSYRDRDETAGPATYRTRAAGSASAAGYRDRDDTTPAAGYRDRNDTTPAAGYRDRAAGSASAAGYRDRDDDAQETQVWYREQQESGSWYREEPVPEGRRRGEPHPDERYWEEREPGTWYREREPETEIMQPGRRESDYQDDDGPYYDTRNPPRYARQQGRPDEEGYDEPDWEPDRGPGTGRYRR